MKKLIILLLMAITAIPIWSQCDLELKELIKKQPEKGVLLREAFFIIEKDPERSPNKADFQIILNKGTTYELLVVNSDKFDGKVSAKMAIVEVNKESGETTIKHLLYNMQPSYYAKGIMRAMFTVPETGIYYMFFPIIEGEKACGYFRLDFISNNRK